MIIAKKVQHSKKNIIVYILHLSWISFHRNEKDYFFRHIQIPWQLFSTREKERKNLSKISDNLIKQKIDFAFLEEICSRIYGHPYIRDTTHILYDLLYVRRGQRAARLLSLTLSVRKIYRCASLSCFTRNLTRFFTTDTSARAAAEFILYNMADCAIKHWRG